MDKPAEMFDRVFEWAELTRFATLPGPRATLGVVSGRRRQGKTFLLDAVTRASGGFMFTATETTEADALRQFGEALARYRGQPTPFRFAHWDEAVAELMRIADAGGPTVAVIDEFPFLAKASPPCLRSSSALWTLLPSTPTLPCVCCCAAPRCRSWAGCCPAMLRFVAEPVSNSWSRPWTSGSRPSSGRSTTRARRC